MDNVVRDRVLDCSGAWDIPDLQPAIYAEHAHPSCVGTATIMLHVILITLQALILRHRYRPIQLLQLPLAVLFGLLTGASNAMLGFLSPSSYLGSWLFCLIGIILVAAGVSAEVLSGTIPLAAEGLSLALSEATGRKFGTMKVSVDCTLVASSLILSSIFLRSLGRSPGRDDRGSPSRGYDSKDIQQGSFAY